MVSVLDYGYGNVGSVIRMIKHVGGDAKCITTPDEILSAKKLVIPGVGAFDHAMDEIVNRKLQDALNTVALKTRIPVLGICLGMQLMCLMSEEGKCKGLAWIDAQVRKFVMSEKYSLRVPHMGWNTLKIVRENPLISADAKEQRFYFVHSYFVCCNDPNDPIALASYGVDFVAAFQRENLFGVQFHPEKSHRFGVELMRTFVGLEVA